MSRFQTLSPYKRLFRPTRWSLTFSLLFGCMTSLFLFLLLLGDARQPIWETWSDFIRSRTLNRAADSQIAKLLIDPSLVGLDPVYVESELENDMQQNGAYNHTIEPASGLSPSYTYRNTNASSPSQAVRAALPRFRGLQCNRSRYPLKTCPFWGQCAPPADDSSDDNTYPCAFWHTGYPDSLRIALELGLEQRAFGQPSPQAPVAPRIPPRLRSRAYDADDDAKPKRRMKDWDLPGHWRGSYWEPRPYESDSIMSNIFSAGHREAYHIFTPSEVQMCFAGKKILLSGDSMLRQIFSRTINYIRGIPSPSEHVFNWGTAEYSAYRDGTDRFVPACPSRNCKTKVPEEALYTITFDWHDHNNLAHNMERFVELEADHVLHGIVYWLAHWQELSDTRNGALDIFKSGWNGTMTWYMTPEKADGNPTEFVLRNQLMRDFVNDLRYNSSYEINSIPADRVASKLNGFNISRNRQVITSNYTDVHFMAAFLVPYPTSLPPGLANIKTAPTLDVRDLYNFNIMQLFLNGICDVPVYSRVGRWPWSP